LNFVWSDDRRAGTLNGFVQMPTSFSRMGPLVWAAAALLPASALAEPMTFELSGNGGNCVGCEWVAAEGEITANTPQAFRDYVSQWGPPHFIALDSPGGSLVSGIELGELIRATGATTLVSDTHPMPEMEHDEEQGLGVCASACVFAFMGGLERFIDDEDRLGEPRDQLKLSLEFPRSHPLPSSPQGPPPRRRSSGC